MGEDVALGLGFENFFQRFERWGLWFSDGKSLFFDVVDFSRGGVCRGLCKSFSLSKVEAPIHDSIRELITWECKEHGVKS